MIRTNIRASNCGGWGAGRASKRQHRRFPPKITHSLRQTGQRSDHAPLETSLRRAAVVDFNYANAGAIVQSREQGSIKARR